MRRPRRQRVFEVCRLIARRGGANGDVATQHVVDGSIGAVTGSSAGTFGTYVSHGIDATSMSPAIFRSWSVACGCGVG